MGQTKQGLRAGWLALVISLTPAAGLALTVQEVPNPRQVNYGWVTDMADVLSPDTEAELNRQISALEAQNGREIMVVTVLETDPSPSPKAFATELFDTWRIGKLGRDNGVLFLISVGDRRTEIETGYGLAEILPDAEVGRILDQDVIPYFRTENYNQGILQGTTSLVARLSEPAPAAKNWLLNSIIQQPWHVRILLIGSIAGTAIALRNMYAVARRPVFLTPQGITRQDRIDSTDRPVYNNAYLTTFGATFATTLVINIVVGWNLFAVEFLIFTTLLIGFVSMFLAPILIWMEFKRQHKLIRPTRCNCCQQPMVTISDSLIQPYLSPAQQVAQRLGSTIFKGCHCPHCYPQLEATSLDQALSTPPDLHIRAYACLSQYTLCPTCEELTVKRNIKVIPPDTTTAHKRLVVSQCQSCSYHHEEEEKDHEIVSERRSSSLSIHRRSRRSSRRRRRRGGAGRNW